MRVDRKDIKVLSLALVMYSKLAEIKLMKYNGGTADDGVAPMSHGRYVNPFLPCTVSSRVQWPEKVPCDVLVMRRKDEQTSVLRLGHLPKDV